MVRADEATRFEPGRSGNPNCGPKAQGTSRMVNVWQHDEREARSPATKKGRCRLHGGAKGSGGPSGERNGKIQRIAENAPRWPDINTFCAALLNMAVEPLAIMLSWSGWGHFGGRIQNNSGLSQDLKATLR